MDMVFEYDNPISGEKERTPIPMGIGFFTLPNNYSGLIYTINCLKCVIMEMVTHFQMFIKCCSYQSISLQKIIESQRKKKKKILIKL